jgi:hypothetical protein
MDKAFPAVSRWRYTVVMYQPTTSAPDGAMNSNKDDGLAETDTTQSKGLEQPGSSAWLIVEFLVVLLVLAFFVIIVRIKTGIL